MKVRRRLGNGLYRLWSLIKSKKTEIGNRNKFYLKKGAKKT